MKQEKNDLQQLMGQLKLEKRNKFINTFYENPTTYAVYAMKQID
jgi:hypothetical protein